MEKPITDVTIDASLGRGVRLLDELLEPVAPFLGREDVVGVLEDPEMPRAQRVGDAARPLAVLSRIGEEDFRLVRRSVEIGFNFGQYASPTAILRSV